MSNQNQQIDPETLSMEELAKLANEEMTNTQEADAAAAQQENFEVGPPRDEQGRFAKREEAAADHVDESEEEVVYRRVIDLGDGSGTQIFEAPSMEELVEKLATAQTHATRKIREQAAAIKQAQAPKQVEPTVDANEEFVLSQEMMSSPTTAFKKMFKNATGMDINEFKTAQSRMQAFTKSQEEFNNAVAFKEANPDFFPSEKNANRIQKWLKVEGLDGTPENIQKAYTDLSESGLLETKPSGTQDADTTEGSAGPRRIAAPTVKIVGQRRVASGLSNQRRLDGPKSQGLTEDELYNMPYEKLQDLAREEAKNQR
jgi:hypothetical protein